MFLCYIETYWWNDIKTYVYIDRTTFSVENIWSIKYTREICICTNIRLMRNNIDMDIDVYSALSIQNMDIQIPMWPSPHNKHIGRFSLRDSTAWVPPTRRGWPVLLEDAAAWQPWVHPAQHSHGNHLPNKNTCRKNMKHTEHMTVICLPLMG